MVGETDVFKLKESMDASIQIDSLPTVVLPAKVTQIAPTATISSGVVNYEVEVEADSLENITATRTQSSEIPTTGNATPTAGASRFARAGQSMVSAAGDTSQLREGLTVTVNVTVSGKKDILLIPGQAIQRSGKDVQVQVVTNGVTETRVIKTGISNWQYTEVTEGLEEGEEVIIQTASVSVATSAAGQRQQSGAFQQGAPVIIPGGGGVIRGGGKHEIV